MSSIENYGSLFDDCLLDELWFDPTFWNDDYKSDYDYSDYDREDYERYADDYDEWLLDIQLGEAFEVDTGNHLKKLKKFINGNNKFRKYDPEFVHPDVAQKFAWYDPIHDFHVNKGYKNSKNKIERMIAKHVKHGGTAACNLVHKIKNCAEYKHSRTFRNASKRYINALEQPQNFSWITNWEWCMSDYVYKDGHVMNKQDARKYWGYEEICNICGKDRGV